MHILDEWKIRDMELKIEGKADKYELSTLRSTVGSLEHSLRESRAEVDGLRARLLELEALLTEMREMRNWWKELYRKSH